MTRRISTPASRHTFSAIYALLSLLFLGCGTTREAERVELLLTGAQVYDGSGGLPNDVSVGISGDRIVFIGNAADALAEQTLDLAGLVLAPGFIDVHNHSVPQILEPGDHLNEGFVRQGVTMVFAGPDGSFSPDHIRRIVESLEVQSTGTNIATYVGHNAIREEVMGTSQAAPTTDEMTAMRALVRAGMEAGAFGLSTGLMYEPGMFSTTDEVAALAEEVQPFDGVYDSHVRDPVWHFVESHAEAIEIGRRAGIPSKLGHLKAVSLDNEGKMKDIIARVEEARVSGHLVVSDQYPYDGAATATLAPIPGVSRGILIVPEELLGDDPDAFDYESALEDPQQREMIARASENGVDGGFAWLKATGYVSMRIVHSVDYPDLVGSYLSEIAAQSGVAPFDAVADLILGAEHAVHITLGAIKEWEVRELLQQEWNMIASDGEYADADSPASHPRSTGTFPRLLGHYARDEGVVTLQDAIRKITSLPADYHRMTDRGRIEVGHFADLTAFDPQRISDRSTWTEPNLYSVGVIHVLVNGEFVLQHERMTGNTSGRFLRHRGKEDPQ